MRKYFILVFLMILFTSVAGEAKEMPIAVNETSSGSAALESDVLKSGNFGLLVETSGGTVSIVFTVYEDDDEVQTLTFTSSAAEKVKYWAGHGTNKLKVSWVITNGTVAKVAVITTS